MEGRKVYCRKERTAGIITIDNPPVNVLDTQVTSELRECLCQLRDDPQVITIIITGAGRKAFMAGANIKGFPQMIGKPGVAYDFLYSVYEVWYLLENLKKPTIAAINGLALGAGLELALSCDLRVMAQDAQLGLPEIKLGLFPGGGGTQRLTRLVGQGVAKELIFTGEPVSAQDALRLGIVNQLTQPGEELETAMGLADKMGKFSLVALGAAKQAINGGANINSLREAIDLEANLWQQVFMSQDVKEGVDAFMQKRAPVFHHC